MKIKSLHTPKMFPQKEVTLIHYTDKRQWKLLFLIALILRFVNDLHVSYFDVLYNLVSTFHIHYLWYYKFRVKAYSKSPPSRHSRFFNAALDSNFNAISGVQYNAMKNQRCPMSIRHRHFNVEKFLRISTLFRRRIDIEIADSL